uniref:Reverse transcriptase domain-containing protein n=1 Tax=Oryza sativa subsp. japonica TaxID=39947 RepID=Q2QRR5_ORYSJ|nr:hypothetical protein LOC_Os12g26660 [Oryza sativa Japonica Group]
MSPILFNIVVDMLAVLIERAKGDGQIGGVIPHLVDDGLSILQYADDTLIFLDHDLEQAKNMKAILCVFEQLSGLKINFHKNILVFLFIIGNSGMLIGKELKIDLRGNSAHGKAKHMSYDQYPTLYNVPRKKQSTVAEVMSTTLLNISFRRAIVGQKLIEWNDLILRLANITLSNEKDCFVWSLHKNGQFSVKSMYAAIMNCNVRIKKRILWDLKIPLKIKVFMWFLHKKVIFMSSYWLHFWSTMLPQEEQDTIRNGATLLESVAKGLLFYYGWRSSIRIGS